MMQHIRFRVGGQVSTGQAQRWPCRDDVRQEAQRRLNASGYNRHRARALATGKDMPEAIHDYALEIALVSEKLIMQKPIPEDYQSNTYWPALRAEH